MSLSRPGKPTLVIALACIIIVVGVIAYAHWPSSNGSPLTQESATIAAPLTSTSTNDDWRKSFFAVSGSSGGSYEASSSLHSSDAAEPLSETDYLGRSFFTAYAQLRQAGATGDAQSVSSAANSVVTDALSHIPAPNTYLLGDIRVSQANDLGAMQTYATELASALRAYVPTENEAEIAANAFDTNDMSTLKDIDPIISGYKAAETSMSSMLVPSQAAERHLDIMNAVSVELWNAQALRNAETDPVRALAAIGQEVPALQALSDAIDGMHEYLGYMGIQF